MAIHEIITDDGEVRKLANLIPYDDPTKTKYLWNMWGLDDSVPLVPRSEWNTLVPDMSDETDPDILYTHDQNGVGQCNADAATGAYEDCRKMAGLSDLRLSAADLYDQINGGSDNGSLLEDGLLKLINVGVGTLDQCGSLWKRGQYTRATPEQRKSNRVLEAFLCPSFDHCYSAVLKGFRLISGIMWSDNFNPDKNGWLPKRGSGRSGGHAIKGYKATRIGNTYGIWHHNSWGQNWGYKGGRFVIPETLYSGPVGGWWAIRSVVAESSDTPVLKG